MKDLRTLRQLSRWLWQTWKGYRTQAMLNMTIGIVLVALDLAFVWVTKLSIDVATHERADATLRTALALLGGIIVAQVALGVAARWIRAVLGVRAQNHRQQAIFARLLGGDWSSLRRFHSGNLLNRLEIDVTQVITFLTESLPSFLCTALQFLGAFVFLYWMDRTLACIVVLILPFFVISSKLYVRKMRRLSHDVRDTESRIQALLQENIQHALVIKTLERTAAALARLSAAQRHLRGQVVRKTKYATVSSTLMNAGFAIGYLFTFGWGVTNLEQGLITYGALIAFIQLVGQIQGPVRSLTKFVPVFINAFTAAERLMELEDMPQERTAPRRLVGREAGIRVENVRFAYTAEGRHILRDFSYDFPPRSITAVVGETGSGKTTLIRLLLALARPQAGHIYIYGGQAAPDRSEECAPATRCNFAYVPQGNTLLSGTIRDNLLLGKPDATEAELLEALDTAAAGFVRRLPKGLDSPCGEMGDGLSEGQAQRIAIARTLLKDAPVLLLDEATSSLDAETEKTVIRHIVERQGHRTLIFVTHRPEVLKYATRVLRLVREARKEEK